jgi:prophage regulatory protein
VVFLCQTIRIEFREWLAETNEGTQVLERFIGMTQITQNAPRVLRRKEVESRVGLSRSSLYALIAAGAFPKQMKLSKRAVGWRADEIDAWIESRTQGGSK